MGTYYLEHTLRMPLDAWPDPVVRAFGRINRQIYVPMPRTSEMGMAGDATLKTWDRFEDLERIDVPTLVIGATHDTMDPAYCGAWPETTVRPFLLLPRRPHVCMYDDQASYLARPC